VQDVEGIFSTSNVYDGLRLLPYETRHDPTPSVLRRGGPVSAVIKGDERAQPRAMTEVSVLCAMTESPLSTWPKQAVSSCGTKP
jgi:predicted ATPase